MLTLIAGGLSNTEIGRRLYMSPKTVSTHVEHLLKKLGTTTRAGAAAVAAEQGLFRLPVPGEAWAKSVFLARLLDQAKRESPTRSASFGLASAAAPPRSLLASRKRPFLLGSAFPLDGPAAADGLEMRNGSALAIAEINAHGGIAGRPIAQLVVDTDIFSPAGVESAFEQLSAADVDAITGGYVFDEETARDAASEYGAPYLHATTSEREVERIREAPELYGRIFHVCRRGALRVRVHPGSWTT